MSLFPLLSGNHVVYIAQVPETGFYYAAIRHIDEVLDDLRFLELCPDKTKILLGELEKIQKGGVVLLNANEYALDIASIIADVLNKGDGNPKEVAAYYIENHLLRCNNSIFET